VETHHSDVLKVQYGPVGVTPPGATGHDVQFYRSDAFLVRRVVEFLARGARIGQPLVVVATEEHRRAIEAGLRREGFEVEDALNAGEVVWLDARETLSSFMVGPRPDRDRFLSLAGKLFDRVLRKRSYLIVRAYGEMVDLLLKDGNPDGAIALEALWNELGNAYPYSLLCGYSVDNFLHEAGAGEVRRVCEQHTFSLPAESIA
jgi:hypothetical protein